MFPGERQAMESARFARRHHKMPISDFHTVDRKRQAFARGFASPRLTNQVKVNARYSPALQLPCGQQAIQEQCAESGSGAVLKS